MTLATMTPCCAPQGYGNRSPNVEREASYRIDERHQEVTQTIRAPRGELWALPYERC